MISVRSHRARDLRRRTVLHEELDRRTIRSIRDPQVEILVLSSLEEQHRAATRELAQLVDHGQPILQEQPAPCAPCV